MVLHPTSVVLRGVYVAAWLLAPSVLLLAHSPLVMQVSWIWGTVSVPDGYAAATAALPPFAASPALPFWLRACRARPRQHRHRAAWCYSGHGVTTVWRHTPTWHAALCTSHPRGAWAHPRLSAPSLQSMARYVACSCVAAAAQARQVRDFVQRPRAVVAQLLEGRQIRVFAGLPLNKEDFIGAVKLGFFLFFRLFFFDICACTVRPCPRAPPCTCAR